MIDWHDWSLLAGVLFSGIGILVDIYGTYIKHRPYLIIGTTLIFYNWIVPEGPLEWIVGIALVGALFFFRKKSDSLLG